MPNKYSEEFPAAGCRSVFPEGEENSFIWRMGRDDSGDSFRPGGRMKEARETILRGSFPRSKGQTGFIPKGRDDRGGHPALWGRRQVRIDLDACRAPSFDRSGKDGFRSFRSFFVERCRKNRKKFCFRFDKWGKCDILSLMRLKNGDDLSSCAVALRTFFPGPKQAFLIFLPESPPKAENSGVRKKNRKKERTVLDKTKNRAKLRTRCSA